MLSVLVPGPHGPVSTLTGICRETLLRHMSLPSALLPLVLTKEKVLTAQANIVAFDGATTPVSHTLVPQGTSLEKGLTSGLWKEQLAAVPDYAQVRFGTKKIRLGSGVFRVSARTEVPVMESVSGQNASGYTAAPKVAFTNTIESTGYFHERSSVNDRRLCRQLHHNIMGNVATTVTPTTSGFVPELFDQLIPAS